MRKRLFARMRRAAAAPIGPPSSDAGIEGADSAPLNGVFPPMIYQRLGRTPATLYLVWDATPHCSDTQKRCTSPSPRRALPIFPPQGESPVRTNPTLSGRSQSSDSTCSLARGKGVTSSSKAASRKIAAAFSSPSGRPNASKNAVTVPCRPSTASLDTIIFTYLNNNLSQTIDTRNDLANDIKTMSGADRLRGNRCSSSQVYAPRSSGGSDFPAYDRARCRPVVGTCWHFRFRSSPVTSECVACGAPVSPATSGQQKIPCFLNPNR
mmetsp:Transcript_14468/g.20833  ORF Transcript_14468/g.20833 Transcript_14468/m.20833 type:complete len:266 (-) Transcript_14468:447-1244(-)